MHDVVVGLANEGRGKVSTAEKAHHSDATLPAAGVTKCVIVCVCVFLSVRVCVRELVCDYLSVRVSQV